MPAPGRTHKSCPADVPAAAREPLASVLERLGYPARNVTWRYSDPTGARELRTNMIEHAEVSSAGLAPALTSSAGSERATTRRALPPHNQLRDRNRSRAARASHE